MLRLHALHLAHHARRFAKQHLHVHVDRAVAELAVRQHETSIARRLADERHRAALARAQLLEEAARFAPERQHIAFLRLAAPDFHRTHRKLFVVHLAELETSARRLHQFRAAVGEATRANIVDRQHGVLLPHRRARIDHALAPALHLGVTALDGIEVERLGIRARHHRTRRAAAETDPHRRTADLDDVRARRHRLLRHLVTDDEAVSARQHNRLVVAALQPVLLMLVGAEEARQLRTSEFVAERCAADRSFRHDLERRRETRRTLAVVLLPRLFAARNAQVRNHEAADARGGARTRTRRRLVADFAAHARRRARIGRDGRWVVVRLHLHQLVKLHLLEAVGTKCLVLGAWCLVAPRTPHKALGTRHEKFRLEALHHRGVVLVGDERPLAVLLVGVLDHPEERILLALPVDDELRPEDLVAAVLGIDLPEHHQLGVGGVAVRRLEGVGEILHLRLGDRKPQLHVRLADGRNAAT